MGLSKHAYDIIFLVPSDVGACALHGLAVSFLLLEPQ